jgi:hypothetical protein
VNNSYVTQMPSAISHRTGMTMPRIKIMIMQEPTLRLIAERDQLAAPTGGQKICNARDI